MPWFVIVDNNIIGSSSQRFFCVEKSISLRVSPSPAQFLTREEEYLQLL
jgi:hypothetical protein